LEKRLLERRCALKVLEADLLGLSAVLREREECPKPFPNARKSHRGHLLASWSLKKSKSDGVGTAT
jgi:hypothetical protein